MSKKQQQKVEVRTSVPFVISRRARPGLPKVQEVEQDHRLKHLRQQPRRPAIG